MATPRNATSTDTPAAPARSAIETWLGVYASLGLLAAPMVGIAVRAAERSAA